MSEVDKLKAHALASAAEIDQRWDFIANALIGDIAATLERHRPILDQFFAEVTPPDKCVCCTRAGLEIGAVTTALWQHFFAHQTCAPAGTSMAARYSVEWFTDRLIDRLVELQRGGG